MTTLADSKCTKRIRDLLGIKLPIVQAGMIWVSGAKLAAAAAEAGCLGVIGAGSMQPELLDTHCQKAKRLTSKPLAVNVPLLYEKAPEQIAVALAAGIRIFITSAGSPKKFTPLLKDKGCVVIHVTSTPGLAQKCQEAGCDAVIGEGFEAGGHNGRDEITTLCLIPQVVNAVDIPVIAAGGIADGRGILAALALGAEAVQMGTRFAATQESSAHANFKKIIIEAGPDATMLSLKDLVPVRLIKNAFYEKVAAASKRGAGPEELKALLGKGRAKAGILEGDLDEGELEIGQIAGLVKDLPHVADLVKRLQTEYSEAWARLF